jgi:hypothetical protein
MRGRNSKGAARKFKVGDQVRPKMGLYRGDLGVVIGTDMKRIRHSGIPAGSFQRLCYIVQLDGNITRKFYSTQLDHP